MPLNEAGRVGAPHIGHQHQLTFRQSRNPAGGIKTFQRQLPRHDQVVALHCSLRGVRSRAAHPLQSACCVRPVQGKCAPHLRALTQTPALPIPCHLCVCVCACVCARVYFLQHATLLALPALSESFASCRIQDVRSTEKDKVVMFNCFRPGDVVLARIVSASVVRRCGHPGAATACPHGKQPHVTWGCHMGVSHGRPNPRIAFRRFHWGTLGLTTSRRQRTNSGSFGRRANQVPNCGPFPGRRWSAHAQVSGSSAKWPSRRTCDAPRHGTMVSPLVAQRRTQQRMAAQQRPVSLPWMLARVLFTGATRRTRAQGTTIKKSRLGSLASTLPNFTTPGRNWSEGLRLRRCASA